VAFEEMQMFYDSSWNLSFQLLTEFTVCIKSQWSCGSQLATSLNKNISGTAFHSGNANLIEGGKKIMALTH
jgi:hypothetical protein